MGQSAKACMDEKSDPTSYGVDGCKGGWLWVGLRPSGTPKFGVAENLAKLVDRARDTDRIFVDIPIGLQAAPRKCDTVARKLLGRPRASSVFRTPARETLDCSRYRDASERNHAITGKKLTKQTFAIMPRIREVDDLLHDNGRARKIVREVHPEVCFRGFAGRAMEFKKDTPDGYTERIAVLRSIRPDVAREIEDMVTRFRGPDVARDDIVDAMAAAITAAADPSLQLTLPEEPELDSRGLPMEMVYADASLNGRATKNASGNIKINPEPYTLIEEKLDEIEHQNSVRILLAVESGSRAWGFPSPDSDYDVRFLYARPRDWYHSINSRRDVIECPIEGVLDINGWDIRNALGLLLKANPVLSEWLCSPIRYKENQAFTQRLRALADRIAFKRSARFHYLHLGKSAYDAKIGNRETIAIKKYFYAIRPALALRWLREREDPPPMDLPGLRAGVQLDPGVDDAVERLVIAKSETAELGTDPRIGDLDRFIEEEFALASAVGVPDGASSPDLLDDANRLFREIVDGDL